MNKQRWFKLALLLLLTVAVAVPSTLAYIVVQSPSLVNTFSAPYFPPEDTSVQLRVHKTVSCIGTECIGPEGFSFVLKNVANAETITMTTGVDGYASVTLPFSDADVGKTYTYHLTEINDGRENVTYSTAAHVIVIALSVNDDNQMVASVTMNDVPVQQVIAEFENIYAAGAVPPQTGDSSHPELYLLCMLLSAAGMLMILRRRVHG